MANRYFVGTGTAWSSTASWAATSGGASGASVPTSADDVFLDALSPGNLTIDIQASARSVDCTGFTHTLTHNSGITLSVGTSTARADNVMLKFVSGMTYTGLASSSIISFGDSSGTALTIDLGGKTVQQIGFNGGASSTCTVSGTPGTGAVTLVFLNGGGVTLATGITWAIGWITLSATSGTRSLTMNNATIICGIGGTNVTAWNASNTTGLTVNAGTGTIQLNNSSSQVFAGGGLTYYTVLLTGPQGGSWSITGNNTFTNLTVSPSGYEEALSITDGSTQTVTGAVNWSGPATNSMLFARATNYTTCTIALGASATVTLSNVNFLGIHFTGTQTPVSGTNLGDGNGNSGITFPASRTLYWVGNAGSWSNATSHWATASNGTPAAANFPRAHDDIVFDANSITVDATTVTVDRSFPGRNLDYSALAHTMIWGAAFYCEPTGNSVVLSPKLSFSGTNYCVWAPLGQGVVTIRMNGVVLIWYTWGGIIPNQTIRLLDTHNVSSAYIDPTFSGATGTYDGNGQTITTAEIISNGSATRSLLLSGCSISLTGTGTVWDTSGTNLTATLTGSTIYITDTGTTAKTFIGGGVTFNNVSVMAGGTGALTVQSSNTFNALTINAPKTVTFQHGTTQNVSSFIAWGSSGNLVTLNSDLAASPWTLRQTSGYVWLDWVSLKDSTATGGAAFYAGADSTNVSGNSGWTFANYPLPLAIATSTSSGLASLTAATHISPTASSATVALLTVTTSGSVALQSFAGTSVNALALTASTAIPLTTAASTSHPLLALTASTSVTLQSSNGTSVDTLALRAPTVMPLNTSASISTDSLIATTTAPIITVTSSSVSVATLNIGTIAPMIITTTSLSNHAMTMMTITPIAGLSASLMNAALAITAPSTPGNETMAGVSVASLIVDTLAPILPITSGDSGATLMIETIAPMIGRANGVSFTTFAATTPAPVFVVTAPLMGSSAANLTVYTRYRASKRRTYGRGYRVPISEVPAPTPRPAVRRRAFGRGRR